MEEIEGQSIDSATATLTRTNNAQTTGADSRPALHEYFQDRMVLLFGLVLAIGAVLRLLSLDESLWYDELWATHIRLENLIRLGNVALFDLHPPFYSILMFFWIRLFGDSEVLVRMPSFILGIFSIVLTYALARRFAGKRVALLSVVLLSLSPVHIWYSGEARPYVITLFLLLSSLFSYYKLQESGRQSMVWYLIYFLTTASAAFSHYYASFYVIGLSLLCLADINRTKRNILLLNALILGLLAAYVGLKYSLGNVPTGSSYLRSFTFKELWLLFFNWFLFGNSLRNGLLVSILRIVFLFFFGLGLTLFFRGRRGEERANSYALDIGLYLFIPPTVLLLLSYSGFRSIYIERSLLVLLPFFYIVVAKGVTGFRSQFVTVVSITLVVAVNVVTLVTFLQRGDEWTVYKPNPDWRAAARYFDDELAGTANSLFVFASTPATALTYYDERFFEGIPLTDRSHRKLAQIQRALGADHPIAKIVSAQVEEYSQSINVRHAQARLFIRYIDTNDLKPLNETLTDSNARDIYFVHNRYWSREFEDLFEIIVRNPRITTQASVDFKGITIYKFGVAKRHD